MTESSKNPTGETACSAQGFRGRATEARVLLLRAVLATLLCVSLLLCGCGQKIGQPGESERGTPPPPNTYVLTYEWQGFPGTTDIVVTVGGYVYVAQESSRVVAYKTFSPQQHPLIAELQDLVKPVYIAEGRNEEMYVADAGDMTVKRFPRSGGAPIQSFADTAWAVFGGIAVDPDGYVYVADKQKEFIWKYRPSGERDSSLKQCDDYGHCWSFGVLSEGGEGVGYVRRPGGLCFNGVYLQVTDTGKNRVQKLVRNQFAFGVLSVLGPALDDPLSSPLDSDSDEAGNIYIADTGKNRVLKYDSSGSLLATVNWDPTYPVGPPVAVAARDKWVYLADPENGKILIYELRQ